jgi:hypothetical protein
VETDPESGTDPFEEQFTARQEAGEGRSGRSTIT